MHKDKGEQLRMRDQYIVIQPDREENMIFLELKILNLMKLTAVYTWCTIPTNFTEAINSEDSKY